jgi:rhodanese-related sulfurtransferase
VGREVDFETLVIPKNLSGAIGSTADDLIRILKENGCRPVYRTSMGASELVNLGCPAILNTAPAMVRAKPNHWIAFLGIEDNRVQLYDPPSGFQQIRMAELMTQWNGAAIILDQREAEFNWWNLEAIFGMLSSTAVLLLLSRINVLRGRAITTILFATLLSAILWHLSIEFSYFDNSYAIATLFAHADEHRDKFQKIDAWQLEGLLSQEDVTVVDARLPSSFQFVHIDGAVNVPISASHGELKEALKEIPQSNKVIFYCQSDQCQWAEKVATRFHYLGYEDITIYPKGMIGWEEHLTQSSSR